MARVHVRFARPRGSVRSRCHTHRPRPWSPVMNGLRRLTLICHFISLIQQPPRALSVPRQSLSPSYRTPISSTSSTSSSSTSSCTATRVRLEHPPHPHPAAYSLTNCFVGGAKKEGGREREERRGRRSRARGWMEKKGMGERERESVKERGKLGLDEKMLRPVALHTRGHQIKSLVVSAAHPSVRSRASE